MFFFLKQANVPAFGFSPITQSPILAHAHNEYLSADVYLKGIDIYKNLISELANVN